MSSQAVARLTFQDGTAGGTSRAASVSAMTTGAARTPAGATVGIVMNAAMTKAWACANGSSATISATSTP